jgi:hypothetical protein
MKEKSKQPWENFPLRTVLAIVAVVAIPVAVFVGYSLKWVRDRREFMQGLTPVTVRYFGPDPQDTIGFFLQSKDAPWQLRWLGERGEATILLSSPDHSKVDRAKSLFPEASVRKVE